MDLYRSYKGGYYLYSGIVGMENDPGRFVLYTHLGSSLTFLMPSVEFFGTGIVDGKEVVRFEKITPSGLCELTKQNVGLEERLAKLERLIGHEIDESKVEVGRA